MNAQANFQTAYRGLEGKINDLSCMARIASRTALEVGDDPESIIFAVTHLAEMVADLDKAYFEAFPGDAAAAKEEVR
jgi:hypothetical protein